MKAAIVLARELQRKGMTVSFWFYGHSPEEIEINVHTRSAYEDGGIENRRVNTRKEISEFLSSILILTKKDSTEVSNEDNCI